LKSAEEIAEQSECTDECTGWTREVCVCDHYTYVQNFCIGLKALLRAIGPSNFGPLGPICIEIKGCVAAAFERRH